MGCPDKIELEDWLLGTGTGSNSEILLAHLRDCTACRKEASFAVGLRSSLRDAPLSPAASDCLSDEMLSLFTDDALPLAERTRCLAHLVSCTRCLRSACALNLSLEALDAEPAQDQVMVPQALLAKARALGAPLLPKPTLAERLFGSLPLRVAWAAGSAAAVLLLFWLFSSSQPPVTPSHEALAETHPVPTTPPQAADPQAIATSLQAERAVPPEAAKLYSTAAPETGKPQPRMATEAKRPWLATLPEKGRADLLARLTSGSDVTAPKLVRALGPQRPTASVAEGYLLGKVLGIIDAFSPGLEKSPRIRALLSETVGSTVLLLRSSKDEPIEKLAHFAESLSQELLSPDAKPETVSRRLEVFSTALQETLQGQEETRVGYELGQLMIALRLPSVSVNLGFSPTTDAWPREPDIKRVRTLLQGSPALTEDSRAALLDHLGKIQQSLPEPSQASRSSAVLEEINRIDESLRPAP